MKNKMFQLCDSSLVPSLIDTVGARDFANQGHMVENCSVHESGLVWYPPFRNQQLGDTRLSVFF